MKMTLQKIEKEMPQKITVQEAAAIMGVTPRFLQMALQQNKFPFGVGVKMGKWSYYINTKRFIGYMKSEVRDICHS
jgi:hypothetical protein